MNALAPCLAVLLTAAVPCAAGAAPAGPGSPIAFPLLDPGEAEPELLLAQRVITRSWGLSEDSVYATVRVPEWRSEGGALAMSAILPGTGELYTGERSGYLFLLAEAVGWSTFAYMARTADDRRDQARAYAGPPGDPNSVWSFERWSEATEQDADELMRLYAADPNAFYERIRDPAYAAGWAAGENRDAFLGLQNSADKRRRVARLAVGGLVLNHVISALDAFRAARIHNLPLMRNIELRIRPAQAAGGATGLRAALEGTF